MGVGGAPSGFTGRPATEYGQYPVSGWPARGATLLARSDGGGAGSGKSGSDSRLEHDSRGHGDLGRIRGCTGAGPNR